MHVVYKDTKDSKPRVFSFDEVELFAPYLEDKNRRTVDQALRFLENHPGSIFEVGTLGALGENSYEVEATLEKLKSARVILKVSHLQVDSDYWWNIYISNNYAFKDEKSYKALIEAIVIYRDVSMSFEVGGVSFN